MRKTTKRMLATGLSSSAAILLFCGIAVAQPVLDGGWTSDVITGIMTDSTYSPYTYNLSGPATFSITDNFVPGDIFYVYDFGHLILTTSFNGAQQSLNPLGESFGDLGWTNPNYSHGSTLLAAGLHELSIQGDGAGGVPAGFYDRIDSAPVPEPSTMLLVGAGIAGFGLIRRMRRTA